MAEQFTSVRNDALEQAIRTIIHDARIPKTLRTALEVYKGNREIGMVRAGQAAPAACPPETIRSGLVGLCLRCNSQSCRCVLSSQPTAIEQGIQIYILHNDESLDWSVEINGLRHDHVTSEVMEALVECAVITAETSLMRALTTRPQ
jgi:hypothetical protein